MCQAYEAERSFVVAHDKWTRLKGYDAQKNGVARDACPLIWPEDCAQWGYGWDAASDGREPW